MSYDYHGEIIFLIITICCLTFVRCDRRMLGGTQTGTEHFPYIARIAVPTYADYFCTGTILHPEWVLTSAYCCVSPFNLAPYEPPNNDLDLSVGHRKDKKLHSLQIRSTSRIILKEPFTGQLGSSDLCLVKVKEKPLNLSEDVQTVEIENMKWPVKEGKPRLNCVEVGWGSQTEPFFFLFEYQNVSVYYGHHVSCPCVEDEVILRKILCLPAINVASKINQEHCTKNKGRALICDNRLVGIYHGTVRTDVLHSSCSLARELCQVSSGYNVYLYTCLHLSWIAKYVPGYKDIKINCPIPHSEAIRLSKNNSTIHKLSFIMYMIVFITMITEIVEKNLECIKYFVGLISTIINSEIIFMMNILRNKFL